jgi:hypothetical protein
MTWHGLIVCPLLLAVSWGIVRGLNWLARARQAEREAIEAERLAKEYARVRPTIIATAARLGEERRQVVRIAE